MPLSRTMALAAIAVAVSVVNTDELLITSAAAAAFSIAAAATAARFTRVQEPLARSTEYWRVTVPMLQDEAFRSTFRVPRHVAAHLTAHFAEAYKPSPHNADRAAPAALQVAVALYRMGRTHSVTDVARQFGIAEGSVINFSDRFARMVVDRFEKEYIKLPTREEFDALSWGWRFLGPIRGVIGALDGTLVIIPCPQDEPDLYFCRKGFHALNFQVMVDYKYRVRFLSGGRPGKVYDGNAILNVPIFAWLLTIPLGYFVLADSGYMPMRSLLTPFRKPAGTALRALFGRFNYFHALSRNVVEKTFGVVKNRFRWMLKGGNWGHRKTTILNVRVAFILHNMCIEAGDRMAIDDSDMNDKNPKFFDDLPEDEKASISKYLSREAHKQHQAQIRAASGKKDFGVFFSRSTQQGCDEFHFVTPHRDRRQEAQGCCCRF